MRFVPPKYSAGSLLCVFVVFVIIVIYRKYDYGKVSSVEIIHLNSFGVFVHFILFRSFIHSFVRSFI